MTLRMFQDVVAYRELVFALTCRDIRVKYKQAVMGVAWAFFLPLLAVLAGLVVRVAMAGLRGELEGGAALNTTELGSVMVRSVAWVLFASVIGGASMSLIGNISLVTKIYFPRQVLPLATLLSSLFDFAISSVGVVLAAAALSLWTAKPVIVLSWNLLYVPLLILILIVMTVGLGLFLAAANLFFRDVKYIVEVLLRFGIFFSGVFIFVSDLPGMMGKLMLLNPVTPLMEALGAAVTGGPIAAEQWTWVGYSAAFAVGVLIIACAVFDRAESLFAEYV